MNGISDELLVAGSCSDSSKVGRFCDVFSEVESLIRRVEQYLLARKRSASGYFEQAHEE